MSEASTTRSRIDGRPRKGRPQAQAHLFLALECDRPLAPAARLTLGGVQELAIGRGSAREVMADGDKLALKVADPWLSTSHATIARVFGRWVLTDAGSKNGSLVNGAPQRRAFLADGDLLELGHTLFLFREGLEAGDDTRGLPGLATLVPSLAELYGRLAQVARSPVPVLLQGETGTGKEVAARALHAASGRAGAFVAVNCGALPPNLVETELFGYRKGAFSGALEDRPGLVRAADGGTLFLDEIGDLPPASQAAFLRVLQEREVTPVGATRPVPVDVALCAATHRDLDGMVARGELRADLHARIAGLVVTLPPLRERREDLGLLVAALLAEIAAGARVTFEPDAARALFRYTWPQNVRELRHVLAAAVALAGDAPIRIEHLPAALRGETASAAEPVDEDPTEEQSQAPLSDEEVAHRAELVELLRAERGNIAAVARALGKARMQIQRWMKRYRLDPDEFRS